MDKTFLYPRLFRDKRQFRLFLLLVLATGLDAMLVLARFMLNQTRVNASGVFDWPEIQGILGLAWGFLAWNLFLAWIPYLAALRFERLQATGAGRLGLLALFAVWLAFLPNAPYIITDFIHLDHRPPVPVWYDMVMLFAFACTGMALGLFSLYEIQLGLRRQFSGKLTHLIIFGAAGLAGFGVWLGRFQRWNSWDILTNPLALAGDIAQTLMIRHELLKAMGISGLIGGMLLLGYAMLSTSLSDEF